MSSSSEEEDEIENGFDNELKEIRNEIYFYLSSLGYIAQITQTSFCPERLIINVHGNTLIHPYSFAEFEIIIIKPNKNAGLIYTFYCQFFVNFERGMPVKPYKQHLRQPKYMFGALTVNKLMNQIKKGIYNLQIDNYH